MTRRLSALLAAVLLSALTLAPSVTAPAEAATPITVSGVVTDQFGHTVAGAEVEAINWYLRGTWETFGSTVTDADGHYSFTFDPHHRVDGEPLWAITLWVSGPDHWTKYQHLPDYAPGDSLVVDVEVEERPHVTGVVTDEHGEPVAGAELRMHNVGAEDESCSDEYGCPTGYWTDRVVTTGADGRFTTWSHPRDLIGVVVSAPGFATQVVYDVESGDQIDVQLVPGVPGLEPMTIRGVVRDVQGTPLPGEEVRLYVDEGVMTATTDGGGAYQFAVHPLALDYWASSLFLDADVDDIYGARATVPRGLSGYYEPGTDHQIDLTLEEPARIQGTAIDEAGNPLPGIDVIINGRRRAVTGTDGRYLFEIRAGFHVLELRSPAHYTEYLTVDVASDEVVQLPTTVLRSLPLPSAPSEVTAHALGPHRAVVEAFYITGGSPIDLRVARCRGRGASMRRARVSGFEPAGWGEIRIRRLEPDQRYRCRTRVRTEVGSSPWSSWSAPFRTPRVRH